MPKRSAQVQCDRGEAETATAQRVAKPAPPRTPPATQTVTSPAKLRNLQALRAARDARPATRIEFTGDGVAASANKDPEAQVDHMLQMHAIFGTASGDFVSVQLGALECATRPRGSARSEGARELNAGLMMVQAIGPGDEVEAALAVQMAATHGLAMEMLGRARHSEYVQHTESYVALATKLQRTFTTQIEALAKLRGGGRQTVEVTHVHKQVNVAPGGQAVVGDVHQGGGARSQSGEQPHDARARGANEMHGEHSTGSAMPSPGSQGSEPMPDAWRPEPRRAGRSQERELQDRAVDQRSDRRTARAAGGSSDRRRARQEASR